MNLDAYDDMMGLEFGDYEGFAGVDAEMIKEAFIASTAGGGAILAAWWGVNKLSTQFDLASKVASPLLRALITSGVTFAAGVGLGKTMYDYNREAAMGILGGLGGIAMANLIDAGIAQMTGNARLTASLGEGDDYMSYGADDGMAALAAVETTGVTTAPGAFSGFADPSVTPEALMGLDGTVVQQESLGGLQAYMPYNA